MCFFFFNDTATTEISTLSLHDALPICYELRIDPHGDFIPANITAEDSPVVRTLQESIRTVTGDRKSTRLNSSHANISYAVFCLKKKELHATLLAVSGLLIHATGLKPHL